MANIKTADSKKKRKYMNRHLVEIIFRKTIWYLMIIILKRNKKFLVENLIYIFNIKIVMIVTKIGH